MRKALGDEQIRVTVRLPMELYAAVVGPQRRYPETGSSHVSTMVRKALLHYLACPAIQQAEQAAAAQQLTLLDHEDAVPCEDPR